MSSDVDCKNTDGMQNNQLEGPTHPKLWCDLIDTRLSTKNALVSHAVRISARRAVNRANATVASDQLAIQLMQSNNQNQKVGRPSTRRDEQISERKAGGGYWAC